MQTINVEQLKSGESLTQFEKIDDENVIEYVVQARQKKVADIIQQADEIDQATQSRIKRVDSDNLHTAKLRELGSLPKDGILEIKNTHN